jgi:hypothetical protein
MYEKARFLCRSEEGNGGGGENVVKKAIVVFSLVEESAEKTDEEIRNDIIKELSGEPALIPWLETVEKVTILKE